MRKFPLFVLAAVLAVSGCQALNPAPATPTPIPPTPTSPPPSEITVCLGYEPESLFIFNAASKAARDVMAAIYDGPVELIDGNPVAVLLEGIPSFSDGSARFIPVGVNPGDPVVNTEGNLVTLSAGVRVFPTGCTSPACAIAYDGVSPLQMDKLIAVYKIKPGILWSDGQPLTAGDSVFSFKTAADPIIPVSKKKVDLTLTYSAIDDLTIEWVSQPGLAVDDLWNYFWMPLPAHLWDGMTADELLSSEDVNRFPLSWGAYMVREWVQGEHIQLVENPHYFRAGEDLPKTEIVNFVFINQTEIENIGQLANGRCDIVSDTLVNTKSLGSDVPENFGFKLISSKSGRLETLALGIKPSSYDDYYYPFGVDRPDIFGDVRIRQAIAYCIDRETLVNEVLNGYAVIADSILPATNEIVAAAAVTRYPYDLAAGRALLDAAGWKDLDLIPETPLTHIGNQQIPYGTPLSLGLLVSDSTLQQEIASMISANLAECGFDVKTVSTPASELYLPGPEGKVFGRQFDLALVTWDTEDQFACELFLSGEIPSDSNDWLGEASGGSNFSGYSNSQYDLECNNFKSAGYDGALQSAASNYLLKTLSDELPVIPLFHHLEKILFVEGLCAPDHVDSESDLFDVFESISLDDVCE
jgi:peptide/nickel transport system substrate-binding protein